MAFEERGYVYYNDSTDATTGERRRVIFVPAHNTDIPAQEAYPGFGEDPPEGSEWKRMPDGCVTFSAPGAAGFSEDGVPVGTPELGTMDITVHYHLTAQLEGLTEAIQLYTWENVLVLQQGPPPAYPASYHETTRNLWVVTSDNGVPTLSWDLFDVVFAGVQRELPEVDGKIIPGYGMSEEMTLVHLPQAIMDAVPLREPCITTYLSGFVSSPDRDTFDRVYDLAYTDASANRVAWCTYMPGQSVKLYRYVDLWANAEMLCEKYMERLCRGAFAYSGAVNVQWRKIGGDGVGHPLSHITFAEPDFTDACGAGDDITAAQGLFIGAIQENGGDDIGGMLVPSPDDNDTFATKASLYSTLTTWTTGLYCRLGYVQTLPNVIQVDFLGTQEWRETKDLELANIVYEGHDEMEGFEYTRSACVIANAEASASSTGSADKAKKEVKKFGSPNENGQNAEIPLHSMPSAGDGEIDPHDTKKFWVAAGTEDLQDGVTIHRFLHDWFQVYYLVQPPGFSREVPVRVSHVCKVFHGIDEETDEDIVTVTSPGTITLPRVEEDMKILWRSPPTGGDKQLTITDEASLAPLLEQIYIIQDEGGLLAWVPQMYTRDWGDPQQTRYKLTLPAPYTGFPINASFNNICNRYRLSPADGDGRRTAQALLGGSSATAARMKGSLTLLHVEPYVEYGDEESSPVVPLTNCTFLGTDF